MVLPTNPGNRPDLKRFPVLDNIDTWRSRDTKSYTQWEQDTTVKLVNINWDADYENVNKFNDKDTRNNYLNSLQAIGASVITNSQKLKFNGGTVYVRVEFGYEICMQANYLIVDSPSYKSPDQVIGPTRYLYFINSSKSVAPNTTELELQLDVFQMYIYDTDINYIDLARGHLPMSYTSVNSFLSNPRENNRGLLAPEPIVGMTLRKTFGQEENIFDGGRSYIIAFTGDYEQNAPQSSPSVGEAFFDYADISQNVNYLAINANELTDVDNWFQAMSNTCPWFISTILCGMFIPNKWINLDQPSNSGHSNTFCGKNVFFPIPSRNGTQVNFTFTADKFAYPSPFNRLAKLYTGQYAICRIYIDSHSQMSGNTPVQDYLIEQCEPNPRIISFTNFVQPDASINFRVLGLSPVAGNGLMLGKYGIPTYQIYDTAIRQKTWQEYYSRNRNIADANAEYTADMNQANNNSAIQGVERTRLAGILQDDTDVNTKNNQEVETRITGDMAATIARNNSDTGNYNNFISSQAATDQGVALMSAGISALGSAAGALGSRASGGATASGVMNGVASVGINLVGVAGSQANLGSATSYNSSSNSNGNSLLTDVTTRQLQFNQQITMNNNQNMTNNNIHNTSANASTAALNLNTETTNATTKRDNRLGDIQADWDNYKAHSGVGSGVSNNGEVGDGNLKEGQVGAMILTAPADIINKAGFSMARFGYTYDGIIDMNGINPSLQIMPLFTYWQANNIVLTNNVAPQLFREELENIFKSGVTVYSDPANIKSVSPLDNIP